MYVCVYIEPKPPPENLADLSEGKPIVSKKKRGRKSRTVYTPHSALNIIFSLCVCTVHS